MSKKNDEILKLFNKIKLNDINYVKKWLNKTDNRNQLSHHGYTPLIWAIFKNKNKITKLLIHNNPDVNITDTKDKKSPLIYATLYGQYNIVELLIKNGADVNYQDKFGRTAFIISCVTTNFDIAKLLIMNGAKIDIKDKNGNKAEDYADRELWGGIKNMLFLLKLKQLSY